MPYRTPYGKHYHEEYGCHGATIPCDTKGLTPCSDCCGGKAGSDEGTGVGAGVGTVAASGGGDGRYEVSDTAAETTDTQSPSAVEENPLATREGLADTLESVSDTAATGIGSKPLSSVPDITEEEFAEELINVIERMGYEGHFGGQPLPDGEFVRQTLETLTADQEFMYAAQDAMFLSRDEVIGHMEDDLTNNAALREELRNVMHSPVALSEREAVEAERRDRIQEAEARMDEIVMLNADHSGPGGDYDVTPAMVVSDQIDAFLDHGRTKEQMSTLHSAETPEGRRYVLARQLEEQGVAPYAADVAPHRAGMVRDALDLLANTQRVGSSGHIPVTPHPNYHGANGKEYEVVPSQGYIDVLRCTDAEEVTAEKSARILVRDGVIGEQIPVWTKNGNREADEVVSEGRVVVTRCDNDGNPILDSHGHTNTWTMDVDTFRKKYDAENISENGVAKPRGGKQRFIQVDRDIAIMVPWGENGALIPQTIDAGGWLNVTDPNDVYGIAAEEFAETYATVEE